MIIYINGQKYSGTRKNLFNILFFKLSLTHFDIKEAEDDKTFSCKTCLVSLHVNHFVTNLLSKSQLYILFSAHVTFSMCTKTGGEEEGAYYHCVFCGRKKYGKRKEKKSS